MDAVDVTTKFAPRREHDARVAMTGQSSMQGRIREQAPKVPTMNIDGNNQLTSRFDRLASPSSFVWLVDSWHLHGSLLRSTPLADDGNFPSFRQY